MKKILCILILCVSMLSLGACGKSEDIEFYRANMEQFFSNVKTIDEMINGINVNEEGYEDKLLDYLDKLNSSFKQMATLEVPTSLVGVKELAEDASLNMITAVDKFHVAYEGEEYDSAMEYEAYQYYAKANKELQYIIRILHGEKFEDVVGINSSEEQNAESGTGTVGEQYEETENVEETESIVETESIEE